MAKKTKIDNEDNILSLSELSKTMEKINPDGFIIEDDSAIKITDWISTGNYALNAQISGSLFKGIPAGRVTMLAGESGSGKTFLCLNIVKHAQKMGYKTIWIDTESALDEDSLYRFGINMKDVLYVPMDTISSVSTYLSNVVDNLIEIKKNGRDIGKYLVIIDSLGNLSTDKEMRDVLTGSDKADMTRPKELKRLFRVCVNKLGKLKIPTIVTNHVYANVGSFIGGNVISGGCLVKNTKVKMSSGRNKNIQTIKVGDYVKTMEGNKEVLATFHYKNKPTIKFTLPSGEIIQCTPEHKFLVEITPNLKWKKAEDLTENDEIFMI